MDSLACSPRTHSNSLCGGCTPVYLVVSAAVITAIVVGILAWMEVGPFAAYAYSEYLAGGLLGFAALLVFCVVEYKCCMEKGMYCGYCVSSPEEIKQEAQEDLEEILAYLRLNAIPPIAYASNLEDISFDASDNNIRDAVMNCKQITFFKFKEGCGLVVPSAGDYAPRYVIVKNPALKIQQIGYFLEEKTEEELQQITREKIENQIADSLAIYQNHLNFIYQKLGYEGTFESKLPISLDSLEIMPDDLGLFLINLKRVTFFNFTDNEDTFILAIPFIVKEAGLKRILILTKRDDELLIQLLDSNGRDVPGGAYMSSEGKDSPNILPEIARKFLQREEYTSGKIVFSPGIGVEE